MWRYKWIIVAAAIVSAGIGYGLSTLQNTLYEAEGTVLLNDPRSSSGIGNEIGLVLDPRRYVRNQAKIIESPQVAQRVAESLGGGITTAAVQEATAATPADDLDAVTVFGTMPTAVQSIEIVDAVVQAYEEIVTEQVQRLTNENIATLEMSRADAAGRTAELDVLIAADPENSTLEAQRTAAINQLVTLDTRIELLATSVALYGSGVQLYIAPEVPATPIQPLPLRNAALAFALGGILSGVWAWWRANLNRVADDRDSPARVLDAPLLAAIPVFKTPATGKPIPTVISPGSEAAEAYQFALSSISFALERVGGATVLITSTSPGDGKTSTAINLSIAAAQDGRPILLIDADERAQGLTRLAGLENVAGISDLNGPGSTDDSIRQWEIVEGTSLRFVPAGKGVVGNTATFFRSDRFRTALASLLDGKEMVIIDSPPVMAAAETADLAAAVDAVVLIVLEGTPLRDLDDAKRRLAMSGTPIIGYVFNRATPRSGLNAYGYGYGRDSEQIR